MTNRKAKDFQDYMQKAMKTAVYPQDNNRWLYLQMSLTGEVGELLNVLKKTLRGDYTLEQKQQEIIEELGGILWYTTAICHELLAEGVIPKSNVIDINKLWTGEYIPEDQKPENIYSYAVIASTFIPAMFLEKHWKDGQIMELIWRFLGCVYQAADAVGSSLSEVADANLNLLDERVKRNGTIKNHRDNV